MTRKTNIIRHKDQEIEDPKCDSELEEKSYHFLKYFRQVKHAFSRRKTQAITPEQPIFRYMISLELIYRIFNYLIDEGEDEKYCYVTGVIDKANNTIIPTNILTPKMAFRNPVFVSGDLNSIKDVLSYLDQFGHTVVLQCHRHPGMWAGSTHPSGTDIRNHKDWEKFYPLIGLIVVKSGYFRFFSAEKNFEVLIYGSEVKKINERTYCLPM